MTRSEQKEKEKRLLRGFLDTIGIQGIRIYFDEKPDLRFILKNTNTLNTTGRIGVEITEHFNDAAVDSSSGGQRLLSFWKAHLLPEIIKIKKRDLDNIHAYISFNKSRLMVASLVISRFIGKIANDIVNLVRNEAQCMRFEEEKTIKHFAIYPVLKQYVNSIKISKADAYFLNWDANFSASYINVNSRKIAQMIDDKNKKAQRYNWDNYKEIWLLIAAAHDNSFNALRMSLEEINCPKIFHTDHVIESCLKSPFDRIFIWADRPDDKNNRWYYQIWHRKVYNMDSAPKV